MGNHFYGPYHWEFSPVRDRAALLDSLNVFCQENTNLYIESLSPSLWRRFTFWRMRSHYQTWLRPDTLSPEPSIFHIPLNDENLATLLEILKIDGMAERSIAHIKGYTGEHGLFWFHGFCDQGDDTLCCSHHVSEAEIGELETKLGIKAEKKFGILKSDREMKEDLNRFAAALQNFRPDDSVDSEPPKKKTD